jgi:hypothetical protein
MSEETGDDGAELRLATRLAALPRELEPVHDRWPAIAAAIGSATAPTPRRHWLPAALAAGLALMLGSGLGGAWIGFGIATRAPAQAPVPEIGVEGIERSYAAAREGYLRELALGGGRLDPATRTALQQNLEVIDRAVHEVRTAMAADPDNPVYVETLLMTREREIEMLADISHNTTTRL